MSCVCQCWKDKEIKLTCYRCNGIVTYMKTQTINQDDEIKIKLDKLKKELKSKQIDIVTLKMDIRDLEAELNSDSDSDTSKDVLSNGAVVSKAGLPKLFYDSTDSIWK